MFLRGKGNRPINKEIAKEIEDGKIVQDLPLLLVNGKLLPLFTVRKPKICSKCGSKLSVNKRYDRYILSSHGVLKIPVTYWECSSEECNEYYSDEIVGVNGSNNYSDEYLQKQFYTRYEGKCSLFNNRTVGKIYTAEDGYEGRAACPTTLWKYEQERGKVSLKKLRETDVPSNGTFHCDGYWIKDGWKNFLEENLGRELTKKEWKKLRYKVIYVIATDEKVILDFEITDINPIFISLIPLFSRLKDRIGEENIHAIVSDEDSAIIDAVRYVLPNAIHSFCVFHQLEKITGIYLEDFKKMDKIPHLDRVFYEKSKELILADNAITSTIYLQELKKMVKGLSDASKKVMKYVEKIYKRNREMLEKGFVPETNNVMEQLFSFIDDFVYQAKSFKITSGLRNWAANMFWVWNNRPYNTGINRGLSPLSIAKLAV